MSKKNLQIKAELYRDIATKCFIIIFNSNFMKIEYKLIKLKNYF